MIITDLRIMGIPARTTNRDNQSARDIGGLWQEFYARQVLEKIPHKISNDVYAIYTDYSSDFTGDYTIIIGALVSSFDIIPDRLVARQFPTENFKIFTATGLMPKAIVDTWGAIWKMDKELKRKYTYDFELYSEQSQDGENAAIEIYIAVD